MHDIIYHDSCQRDWVRYRFAGGNTCEIVDIQVGTERRTGIGRRLVAEVMRAARENGATTVYAIARTSNEIACHFYEALEFRICGRLHRFYGMENALLYVKDL